MKIKNLPLGLRSSREIRRRELSVEFDCFSQDATDGLQTVQYRINVGNAIPTIVFQLERRAVSEAKIHATCEYITRFMRDALTDAMLALVYEACHVVHKTKPNTDAELIREVSIHAKQVSRGRIHSGVAETSERKKLTADIRAGSKQRLALLKSYVFDYRRRFAEYKRQARRSGNNSWSEDRFIKSVWQDYERQVYSKSPQDFLKYAKKVRQGKLTAKEATDEWLGAEYNIPPSSIDRHYNRPTKRIPPYASVVTFQPEYIISL